MARAVPDLAPTPGAEAIARRTWLAHINDQASFNRELSKILANAAKQGEQIILNTLGDGIGAQVRRAQYQIAVAQLNQLSATMWGQITPSMERAIARTTQTAVDGLMLIDQVLARSLTNVAVRDAFLAAGRNGADNVRSRLLNNINLSPQVYRTEALSNQWVAREVNRGIALNQSSKEIARSVRRFIRPDVPGGVSYAAQRLGRTELNNAFHTTTVRAAADQPWVTGFLWHTSGSHPKPDECDQFASEDHDKLGKGVFAANNVPGKPHPQCLCYITTISVDEEEFIDSMVKGKYDKFMTGNEESGFWAPEAPVKKSIDKAVDLYSKHLGGVVGGDAQSDLGSILSGTRGYTIGDFSKDSQFMRRQVLPEDFHRIYASQPSVDMSQVNALARSKVDLSTLDADFPIVLVRLDGKSVIVDGHHRLLAAAERNEPVNVWQYRDPISSKQLGIDAPFQDL